MLLVDVDAICKLAHWNILPLLPDITGRPWSETGTVSSLIYRAKSAATKPDRKLFHTTDAAEIAIDALTRMATSIGEPSAHILESLITSNQIDAGEAVLLATIADQPNGVLLTGDKRALRALAGHELAPIFAGRIMLIEHVIWLCLEMNGLDWTRANICPQRGIDKAISVLFGYRCDARTDSVREGVESYLGEIKRLHNPSLLVDLPMQRGN